MSAFGAFDGGAFDSIAFDVGLALTDDILDFIAYKTSDISMTFLVAKTKDINFNVTKEVDK